MPTVLTDLLNNGRGADLSSLRLVMCGGSAVPRALIEGYLDAFGVPIVQGWGMTETSPVCAIGHPPKDMAGDDEVAWRVAHRPHPAGCRAADHRRQRRDGRRGTASRWARSRCAGRGSPRRTTSVDDPEKFHDGWLRTGDVASVSPNGYVMISDRAKDVIKSGGEWVSSVDLENTLMGHPDVLEAAVIGVPDERWDERPLACVVRRADSQVTAAELRDWLAERTAKFWLPERWTFIAEVPKTSVGKFDKKVLRARHAADQLEVEKLAG